MHRIRLPLALLALALFPSSARADSLNGLRSAVVRMGDVNGDGIPDLAVASRDHVFPERVWFLSGKDGTRLLTIEGRAPGDGFGTEVRAIGDWDRDGAADVAISARVPLTRDGYRRLISGRTGATLAEFAGLGPIGGTRDIDGDGRPDLLIANACPSAAEVSVLSNLDLHEIVGVPRRELAPGIRESRIEALTWIEDADGRKGFCSARSSRTVLNRQTLTGFEVEMRSAKDGALVWSREIEPNSVSDLVLLCALGPHEPGGSERVVAACEDQRIEVLDGRTGAVLHEKQAPRGNLYSYGSSIDRVGDIDLDGVEDWIVAANESWEKMFDSGICNVISGQSGRLIRSLRGDDHFGFDACGLGDVNGDGVPDFAVGLERQVGRKPGCDSEASVQVRSGKDLSVLWIRRQVDLRW
jgi:hypothetical protein